MVAAASGFAARVGDTAFPKRLLVSAARTLLGSARLMEEAQTCWQIRSGLDLLAQALG